MASVSRAHKNVTLVKREAQRTPLQNLFPDSPQKSISVASLSVYFNKENQTPKQKSACRPSAECTKLSGLAKREAQRMPLQVLFADSPQKSISGTHISGGAAAAYSNKENLTPKLLQGKKSACHPSEVNTKLFMLRKNEAQRMPFQTLLVDSPHKISDTHSSVGLARSRNPTSYENSMDKNKYSLRRVKRWTMVLDITCLLDKNSRTALQLLEGIKGTQLIIPTAVVRELDLMKQQGSIFRRKTDAFSASQWIEESSVRTKWWIQIQNSMKEDGNFTALTPLASPPTEDQVLHYALYLRSIQNEEQLILLSDDATMKIKAMAKGLICETAEEFRESLVNPFSKRFLWADSSPRGQTWSYLDDMILRDHFYPGSLKTTRKGVKGLKLMLLM